VAYVLHCKYFTLRIVDEQFLLLNLNRALFRWLFILDSQDLRTCGLEAPVRQNFMQRKLGTCISNILLLLLLTDIHQSKDGTIDAWVQDKIFIVNLDTSQFFECKVVNFRVNCYVWKLDVIVDLKIYSLRHSVDNWVNNRRVGSTCQKFVNFFLLSIDDCFLYDQFTFVDQIVPTLG
jgi:hypothetical protein